MRVINAIRSAIRFSTSQRETPKELPLPPLSLSPFLSRQARNFHEFSRNLMSARLILSYTKEIYGSNKSNLYVPPPPCKIHQLCNLTLPPSSASVPTTSPSPSLDESYMQLGVLFFNKEMSRISPNNAQKTFCVCSSSFDIYFFHSSTQDLFETELRERVRWEKGKIFIHLESGFVLNPLS